MSVRLRVETRTEGDAMARLRGQMDVRAMLMAAGRELLSGVEDAFEREGPGWIDLADSTVRERRRKGFGPRHPIQHRTGEYKRSWKAVIDGDKLEISSASFKTILMKSGRNRPARRVRIAMTDIKRAVEAARKALHAR